MSDLFDNKTLIPMMMHKSEPFDSKDYIFELKHDGARCLAYINGTDVQLISRNQINLTVKFPEFAELSALVKERLILDCELIVPKDDRASFKSFLSRMHQHNSERIARSAKNLPAQLIVFDVLYQGGKDLTQLPLLERKGILDEVLFEGKLALIARYIEDKGREFFALIQEMNLEGIVAKNKHSSYYFGKRTYEWLKIKNPDFVRDCT